MIQNFEIGEKVRYYPKDSPSEPAIIVGYKETGYKRSRYGTPIRYKVRADFGIEYCGANKLRKVKDVTNKRKVQ